MGTLQATDDAHVDAEKGTFNQIEMSGMATINLLCPTKPLQVATYTGRNQCVVQAGLAIIDDVFLFIMAFV